MIRRATVGILLLACAVNLLAAGSALAEDIIRYKARDDVKEYKGTILKDTYSGISIMVGGAQFVVKRNDVVGVPLYGGSDIDSTKEAMQAVADADFESALEKLSKAMKRAKLLPPERKPMIQQYLVYYIGFCYFKMGEYDKAEKYFQSLVSKMGDTAMYFEAMLYHAKCMEKSGASASKVADRYRFLKSDFQKKGGNLENGKKAISLAEFGELRPQILRAVKSSGNDSKVRALGDKLMNIAKAGSKTFSASDKAEIVNYQAHIYRYLKKYKELVEILNRTIRSAQVENDRDSLRGLYIERADSYWGLMEDEKANSAKKELARRAMFDYLRATLVFGLDSKTNAKANYRIGYSMYMLKVKDWENLALRHLSRAQGSATPFGAEAKKLLPKVKAAKAAADKAKSGKK